MYILLCSSQAMFVPPPGYPLHQRNPMYGHQYMGNYPPNHFPLHPHQLTRVHLPPPPHVSQVHYAPHLRPGVAPPQDQNQPPTPPSSKPQKHPNDATPKPKTTISKMSPTDPNAFKSPARSLNLPHEYRNNRPSSFPVSPGSPWVPSVGYLPSHLLSPENMGLQRGNPMHPSNHFPSPPVQGSSVQLGYGASGLYGYYLSPSPQRNPMYSPTFERRNDFNKPRMESLSSPLVSKSKQRGGARKQSSPPTNGLPR